MKKFEIQWEAPEFLYQDKDISWYWISIIIAIIILLIAVWQRNFLFGLFVVVAEMMILIWGNAQPRNVKFKITEKGIYLGARQFYFYKELAYFSINDEIDDDWTEICLTFKTKVRSPAKALISNDEVENVCAHMKLFLKEGEYQTTLSDSLIRFLGL